MNNNGLRPPNELVREICHNIRVLDSRKPLSAITADWTILLTASNIHAYLLDRYRNKMIYRDLGTFLCEKLGINIAPNWNWLYIQHVWRQMVAFFQSVFTPDQVYDSIHIGIGFDGQHSGGQCKNVKIEQHQSEGKFMLETNHVRAHVKAEKRNFGYRYVSCGVCVGKTNNVHLLYALRLIAPLIQPIRLNACDWDLPKVGRSGPPTPNNANLLHCLDTMAHSGCVYMLELTGKEFLCGPSGAAVLNKYTKLFITMRGDCDPFVEPAPADCGCGCAGPQFRRAFIAWLTSGTTTDDGNCVVDDRTKECVFRSPFCAKRDVRKLVTEIKQQFRRAKARAKFVLSLDAWCKDELEAFTVANERTGEQLDFRKRHNTYLGAPLFCFVRDQKGASLDGDHRFVTRNTIKIDLFNDT